MANPSVRRPTGGAVEDCALIGNRATNILFLDSIFFLGGAERVTYDLVHRLDRERYRPVLCTLYEPGPVGEWFIRDGFRFYQRLISFAYDVRALWRLGRIIVREQIGLIYLINQPLTMFWGLLASKWHHIPIISVVHNTFFGGETPKSRVTRMLMTRADAIVAVAEMQREHLVRNERMPESLVRVIHNGIDLAHFQPRVGREEQRRSLGLDPMGPVVGIVGRLVHLKGLDIFLQAAKAVLKDLPATQFLIVGDGPEGESLKNLSRALGVESSVFFLGRRDDIADLIQVFDIAVLCSRTEALPMVILEYMALAKPVIATRVGSVPELVIDEETGLVIHAEDAKGLVDALLALLRQPGRAKQMGLAGRERVQSSFLVSNTVQKTQQLFSELLRR